MTNENKPFAMIAGQAEGAIPNGARIRKSYSEPLDTTLTGELGWVLASHVFTDEMKAAIRAKNPTQRCPDFVYFVEWDHSPGVPVGVGGYKIEPV